MRAEQIGKAFRAAKLDPGDVLAVSTPDGREVHIAGLSIGENHVDVRLDGIPEGGDPSFRIVNPPTLVPDPAGDHIVRGQRFRVDPLTAIATVIAQSGGAAQKARRRTR